MLVVLYDLLNAGAFQMLFSLSDLLLSRGKPVLFPNVEQGQDSNKNMGKNNPLDYMGACRTWCCVCGCTWSVSVHTISSHAIINSIFLKLCARHICVEYTQIHTYMVYMYTHMHLAYTHIYINTQRTLL